MERQPRQSLRNPRLCGRIIEQPQCPKEYFSRLLIVGSQAVRLWVSRTGYASDGTAVADLDMSCHAHGIQIESAPGVPAE